MDGFAFAAPPFLRQSADSRMPGAAFARLEKEKAPAGPQDAPKPPERTSFDMDGFAYWNYSFCRTYCLSGTLLPAFRELCGKRPGELTAGDIAVLEPGTDTVHVELYKESRQRQKEILQRLSERIRAWGKGRAYRFGHLVFLSAAREELFRRMDAMKQQAAFDDTQRQQELQVLENSWRETLRKKDAEYADLQDELQRQRERQALWDREKDELRERHAGELQKLRDAIEERDSRIQWLNRRLGRPRDVKGIAAWAAENLSDRLVLHPAAVNLLKDKSIQGMDADLICSALDYLASEYWEQRYERLPKEEAMSRCEWKYGRPFEIAPVGDLSPAMYYKDYHVPYGEPAVQTTLDTHLRVGHSAGSLVRIYFFHDDRNRRIVVGSLPKHLTTATIH